MAPPLDKPSPTPQAPAPTFPGCDPERLREATKLAHALGLEGEVVHSSSDPDELRAYLMSLPYVESEPACAPTS
jgi:hypothetical protein